MTDDEAPAGRGLIRLSLAGTALFVVVSGVAVAADGVPRNGAAVVSLLMFAVGCVVYLVGYATAIRRSRTDEIGMAALVFLAGAAPSAVRRLLLGSTAVEVVVAITAAAVRPFSTLAFGILAPVFGLGVQCLWSARHGTFPRRTDPPRRLPATPPPATPAPTASTTPPRPDRARRDPAAGRPGAERNPAARSEPPTP